MRALHVQQHEMCASLASLWPAGHMEEYEDRSIGVCDTRMRRDEYEYEICAQGARR